MGKSKNLKSALQSQQSRLTKKAKAAQAAEIAESRSKNKGKPKGKEHSKPSINPFYSGDKILLIGEGNFSFARALVAQDTDSTKQPLFPRNITATAYDSEEECYIKYPDAKEIVAELRVGGVEVLFSVDGTCLSRTSALKGRRWDRIVWNFPHAGKGITDQNRNILSNQVLILDFLRSASGMLRLGAIPNAMKYRKKKAQSDEDDEDEKVEDDIPDIPIETRGTVLITLRNVPPYTLWDIPRLAKNPPPPTGSNPPNPKFSVLRSFAFQRSRWKGYEHKMTKGERAHGSGTTGRGGEDRMWEFYLQDDLDS